MNRAAVTLFLAALTLLGVFSCSSDSNSTGPSPVRPARTIYVDAANIDSADGSSAHPYKTVTAALNAGVADDTIRISAGTYSSDESFPLQLNPGNVLIGGDSSQSTIQGSLLDDNAGSSNPVRIQNLHFTGFTFARDAVTGTVAGTNLIRNCLVDSNVTIAHGGGHNFQVNACHIVGELSFIHGAGSSINRVLGNQVDGGIRFANGNGATDSVLGNQIWGGEFVYESGSSDAFIESNEVHYAPFIDRSGAGPQIVQYNTFDYWGTEDPEAAAVELRGSSVTFQHNVVHGFYGPAINATSGTPTIINDNIVQVGNALYCLRTRAGEGEIVGNTITGGPCGLHDESAATLIARNTILDSDTGLFCAGAAAIRGNDISECKGPGLVLMGATGPVDSNYVHENADGAIIASGSPDLGGGAAGSVGHNTFYRNSRYSLINYSAEAIKAENNVWNYPIAEMIGYFEIYDRSDDNSVGAVDFEPFLPPTQLF